MLGGSEDAPGLASRLGNCEVAEAEQVLVFCCCNFELTVCPPGREKVVLALTNTSIYS